MQSIDYVKASLEAFPQGQDFLSTVLTELKWKSPSQSPHHSDPTAGIAASKHSLSHSASLSHFHNDATSVLWIVRQIWNHYRIGTMAEAQYALSSSPDKEHLPALALSSYMNHLSVIATESKQVMKKESFLILLADVIDYYHRDIPSGASSSAVAQSERAQALLQYLVRIQEEHSHAFVTFPSFLTILLDVIGVIHQAKADSAKSSRTSQKSGSH